MLQEDHFAEIAFNVDNSSPALLTVNLNDNNEYQILDHRRLPITNLPPVPLTYEEAAVTVGSLLEHVSRFKYIESNQNRLLRIDVLRLDSSIYTVVSQSSSEIYIPDYRKSI